MAVSFVALLKCVVVNGVKVIKLMQRVNFKYSLILIPYAERAGSQYV